MTEDQQLKASFEQIRGLLYGCLIGDAVALPAEGFSRQRIAAFYKHGWRHRLLGARGMMSDDTEQTFLVAQALLHAKGDVKCFRKRLAWKLRLWFWCLPAGIGRATLRSLFKLSLGWPATSSGVVSAANGSAMRVAIIGALYPDDLALRREMVLAASHITHRHPLSDAASLAMAEIAAWIIQKGTTAELMNVLSSICDDQAWRQMLDQINTALEEQISLDEFTERLGIDRAVSGYIMHTFPVLLFAFLRYRDEDARVGFIAVWNCGGDVDTVGAMLGSLIGLDKGYAALPQDWITGIWEWPRRLAVFDRLAQSLDAYPQSQQVSYAWYLLPLRNIFFLIVVLLHGFRRLFPPYR